MSLNNGQSASGVSQGLLLGPVLFVFYSSDLPKLIFNSEVYLYRDDTKIIYKIIYVMMQLFLPATTYRKFWNSQNIIISQ